MMIEDRYYEYGLQQMERAEREPRKYNGYKDKSERICFYTGMNYADRHEVFYGNPDREISMAHGFQVDLCAEKHRELHENCTPWAKEENAKWKYVYERLYLDKLIGQDITEKMALRYWMNLIRWNYIEELMPE